MSCDISYVRPLVEAACQYARNPKRCTQEHYEYLRRFEPGRNYYKAAATILLDLREGAEIHEAQPAKAQGEGKR